MRTARVRLNRFNRLNRLLKGLQGRWNALRALCVALIALGLVTGATGSAEAADAEKGLISDSKYESPTFGYRVEWGDAWEAEPAATYVDPAYDVLTVTTWGAILEVFGVGDGASTDDVLERAIAFGSPLEEAACEEIDEEWLSTWEVVDEGQEDGADYRLLSGDFDGDLNVWYLEAREVDGPDGEPVVVVASLVSVGEMFADNLEYAADEVELEGFPIVLAGEAIEADELGDVDAVDSAEVASVDAQGAADDTVYRSPTYGFVIDWEGDWELFDKSSDGNIDTLDLRNPETLGHLYLKGFATEASVETSRDDVAEGLVELFEGGEILTEGEGDGFAYATIRGTQKGDDYVGVAYLELRVVESIEDLDASIVTLTLLWAPEDDFEKTTMAANEGIEIEGEPLLLGAEAVAGEDSDDERDAVECEEVPFEDAEEEDEEANEDNGGRERPDENGLIGDDAYRSPTFGFEVEWSGDWLADDAVVGEASDQLYLMNEDDTAQIWLTGLATDEPLDEVRDEFAIGFVGQVSEESELLDRGESNGVAWATFTIEFEEAGTVIAYVEAREIEAAEPDEPAIVTVTIFFAVEPLFDDLIADATEHVELEGETILLSYE
jgi:hypothetical protein